MHTAINTYCSAKRSTFNFKHNSQGKLSSSGLMGLAAVLDDDDDDLDDGSDTLLTMAALIMINEVHTIRCLGAKIPVRAGCKIPIAWCCQQHPKSAVGAPIRSYKKE
jgi:hypothetical protein